MLATALRSLILLECETEGDGPEIVAEFPLEGRATSLGWDGLSQQVVVAVNGTTADRLCFCDAGDESLEDVPLPSGARALGLSFYSDGERRKSWVAVSCSDGAVRLVDCSPRRAAAVVRSSYAHSTAATAVAISREGKWLASGSSSGQVVQQPFHGSGPTALPGMADEAAIEALCYSSMRQELLAAGDEHGNLQVWDVEEMRHSCRFQRAHHGALRGLSFSTQNSDLLISGGIDAELVFWDVKNSKQIQQVSIESGISALSYHGGGYLLAAATLDASVLIFDLRMLVATQAPAQPLHRFTAHCEDGGPLRALGFASFALDGPKKASGAASPVSKSFFEEKVPNFATIESMMDRLSKRVSAEGDTSERFTWPQSVPPLPAKPEPETPEVDRQAARYSIGSPLEEPTVTASPWWKQTEKAEPKPAEPAVEPGRLEELSPLLKELKEDFRKQLQEAQLALMEQNFQLHAELRKDVNALRAELQHLRAELPR